MSGEITRGYRNIIRRLLDWRPAESVTLSLDAESYREWKAFQREVETQMADGGRLCRLRDWGSKLPGAALRIAGMLNAARQPDLSVLSAPIGLLVMRPVLRFCATAISHAIASYDLIAEDRATTTAKRILHWLRSKHTCKVAKRDCFRAHHPHVFERVDQMEGPLKILEDHHLIRLRERKTGGRGSEVIEINPTLLEFNLVQLDPASTGDP
jgi:putative DNA primase/helicase